MTATTPYSPGSARYTLTPPGVWPAPVAIAALTLSGLLAALTVEAPAAAVLAWIALSVPLLTLARYGLSRRPTRAGVDGEQP